MMWKPVNEDRRRAYFSAPAYRVADSLAIICMLVLLASCASMRGPLRERLTSPDERTQRSAFNDFDALDNAAKKGYLPVLKNLLYNKKPDTRVRAAMSLGRMGRAASEAVPDLAHVLGEEDDDLRLASIGALGRMGADGVPALVSVLNHSVFEVRRAAADALGDIGPEAREAAPALALLLGDQDRDTARRAAFALGKIGHDAVPVIVQAARHGDRSAVEMAETAFSIEKMDSQLVQDIVRLLQDQSEEPRVRTFAAAALGRMREPAKGALPALVQALGDQHVDVRNAARGTLGGMGTAAVPTLMEALNDRRPPVRAAAASALGDLGPAAEDAVPSLLKLFQDEDRAVRIDAILAVGKIKVTSRTAVQALIRVLESDKDDIVRLDAVRVLNKIETSEAQEAVSKYSEKNNAR